MHGSASAGAVAPMTSANESALPAASAWARKVWHLSTRASYRGAEKGGLSWYDPDGVSSSPRMRDDEKKEPWLPNGASTSEKAVQYNGRVWLSGDAKSSPVTPKVPCRLRHARGTHTHGSAGGCVLTC